MKDLSDFRISYDKLSLIENHLPKEPIKLFQIWFEELCNSNSVLEPNAMTLSTVGNENKPRNRVVLLKKFSAALWTQDGDFEGLANVKYISKNIT